LLTISSYPSPERREARLHIVFAREALPAARGARLPETALLVLFLLAAAFFLFVDPRTVPIVLWDESRNAVNALEMRQSGWSLVTTYGFEPDLWNTKPPLLIWLMTGSMALFGPSEWALRLPSAVAAMATLLILILFVRRITGSLATGVTAGAFLLLSPGFFGEGGARTGDYDALLLFFTTAYLQLLFLAVHDRRPRLTAFLLTGLMIGGAAMTKTAAGLIPGAGVAVYLLLTRRWPRLSDNAGGYALMALAAAAPLLLFYAAREAMSPGYLSAVVHNDLFGRFGDRVTGGPTSPWLYARELVSGWFFAGPFVLAAPLALRDLRGKSRALMLYSLCTAGVTILIYSAASTRLLHYVLPAFPALAAAAALSLRCLAHKFIVSPLRRRGGLSAVQPVALAFVALLVFGQLGARSLYWRTDGFAAREFYPQASYGDLFAALSNRGVTKAVAVDPGFALAETNYTPLLRAYRLIWRERGLMVEHRVSLEQASGPVVASCDPVTAAALRRRGPEVANVPGCAAVRTARP
jgi:4-amino-4-deoxy-L-arabinose transferase-like glycosyltransferase